MLTHNTTGITSKVCPGFMWNKHKTRQPKFAVLWRQHGMNCLLINFGLVLVSYNKLV